MAKRRRSAGYPWEVHLIYVMTTYDVADEAALRAEREDGTWPGLRAAGAMPLALWRVFLGAKPGQILEMVRYDSLVHWAGLTGAFSPVVPGTRPIHVFSMAPASRRHPGGEPSPVRPGNVWALRRMQTLPGQTERMVELSEDVFWAKSQIGTRQTTLGMLLAIGSEHREIQMLTRYESLADWESTREGAVPFATSAAEAKAARAARTERNLAVSAMGVRLLFPLSAVGPDASTIVETGGGR